jgi:chromosome segregation ATPase
MKNLISNILFSSRQRIAQKQNESNQLKEQKIDIDEELTLKEQEEIEVKDKIKDLDQEQINLKIELESISKHFKTVEINRSHSTKQLNDKKQILQRLQSELRIGKEKRTKTEQELRKQEQVLQNTQQQLQKCQQKESQCYLDEQKTRFEIETAEQNVKLAEKLFDAAKKNFEALENYIKANPKEKVVGHDTKKNIVDKSQQALETSKVDLNNRNDLLKKRTEDFNRAKTNTKKTEYILEQAQNELRIRKNDVATAHQQVLLIEQNVLEQVRDMDNTLKQYNDVEDEYKQIEEQVHDKNKEIQFIEQQLSIERNKFDIVHIHLNDLKDKQTDVITNIEQVEKDLQEYQKTLAEHQIIIDKIDDNRIKQTRLKRDIGQKRIEIQLTSIQRKEYYIKGRIDNFQQILLMINKNSDDLQLELNQQKTRYNQMIKDQSKLEHNLQLLEKKIEDSERRMEQYENERQQLKRDLTIKYRDLIEKKLEYQRFEYDLNQYQNELELKQRQYRQVDQRKTSLIDWLDKNQREIKQSEIKIDETKKNIEKQGQIEQKIRTALEDRDREKEEKIYRIQRLTDQISDLFKQYNDGKYQQNEYLNGLKSIQDMKMNSISKLIDYERGLFNRRSKLNLLNHAITSKWNDIRNYKEKQNRYTFDLYYEPLEEKK